MDFEQKIQYLKGVGPKKSVALSALGISVIYDLLTYYPRRYEDQSCITGIADLNVGELETVSGIITNVIEKKAPRGRGILTAMISDGTGCLQVTWFNQGFMKKKLKVGATGAGFHEVVRGYFHEGRAFREFFRGHALPLAEAASGNEIRNRGHLTGNGGQFGFPHGT